MWLSDLTMVIPTFNRPRMLRDILKFYTNQEVRFKIVVLDSSEEPARVLNERTATDFLPDLLYLQYPPNIGAAKLRSGADRLETPYAVFATDDDVFCIDGLIAALEFLRHNPEFSGCQGNYYGAAYSEQSGLKIVVEQAVVAHDSADPFARIVALLSRYQSIFYSVQRRDAFVAALDMPSSITSGHFDELFHACVLLIQGKVGALARPYIVRDQQKGGDFHYINHPMGMLFHDSGAFAAQYVNFRHHLAVRLGQFDSSRSWEHAIDLAYALYFYRSFDVGTLVREFARIGLVAESDVEHVKEILKVPNAAPIPSVELVKLLDPLLASGWPFYG